MAYLVSKFYEFNAFNDISVISNQKMTTTTYSQKHSRLFRKTPPHPGLIDQPLAYRVFVAPNAN